MARRSGGAIRGRTRFALAGTAYHRTWRPVADLDWAGSMSTERMSLAGSVRVLRARPTARLRLEESGAHVERRSTGHLVVDPPRVDRVRESRGRGARSAYEDARRAGIATEGARATPPWHADVREARARTRVATVASSDASECDAPESRTPAWVAGCEEQRLTWRENPSWVPPVERRRGWGKVLDPARPGPVLLGGRM